MENKVENKVAEQQEQPKKDEATSEKRAMKIRLKSGVTAGAVVAVHL